MKTFEIQVPFTQKQTLIGRGTIIAKIIAETQEEAEALFKAHAPECVFDNDQVHLDTLDDEVDLDNDVEADEDMVINWDAQTVWEEVVEEMAEEDLVEV